MSELDFSGDESGERLANIFRAEHGVADGVPVIDLVARAELGFRADVMFIEMPTIVDAVTCRDARTGVTLIAIATSMNPERQRFSLAHEIGHLAAGDLHTDARDSSTESRAHAFARHLLLPREALHEFINARSIQTIDLRALSDIVEHFRVSGHVAAIQLHREGLIDEATYAEWRDVEASDLAVRFGWAEVHDARIVEASTSIPPQRILANATEAYIGRMMSLETVAAVEGISAAQLQKRFEAANVFPVQRFEGISIDDL